MRVVGLSKHFLDSVLDYRIAIANVCKFKPNLGAPVTYFHVPVLEIHRCKWKDVQPLKIWSYQCIIICCNCTGSHASMTLYYLSSHTRH